MGNIFLKDLGTLSFPGCTSQRGKIDFVKYCWGSYIFINPTAFWGSVVLFWFEIVTLSDFTSCMFFPYVYLPTVCLHVLTFSSPTQHGTYRAGIWNIQYTSNNSFLLAIDFIVLFSNLKKTLKSNLQIFKYHIYIYLYYIFFATVTLTLGQRNGWWHSRLQFAGRGVWVCGLGRGFLFDA